MVPPPPPPLSSLPHPTASRTATSRIAPALQTLMSLRNISLTSDRGGPCFACHYVSTRQVVSEPLLRRGGGGLAQLVRTCGAAVFSRVTVHFMPRSVC